MSQCFHVHHAVYLPGPHLLVKGNCVVGVCCPWQFCNYVAAYSPCNCPTRLNMLIEIKAQNCLFSLEVDMALSSSRVLDTAATAVHRHDVDDDIRL